MKNNVKPLSKIHARVMQASTPAGRASWDDMESLHRQLDSAFTAMTSLFVTVIDEVRASDALLHSIEDMPVFLKNCELYQKDSDDRVEVLNEIYAQHQGKTGVVGDHDDHMLYLGMCQRYAELNDFFEQILAPTQAAIISAYEMAKMRLERSGAPTPRLTPEQDPSVITDVIVH